MERKIPAVMLSQHPDHALKPYWHSQEFISAHDELPECFLSFSDLQADECMWDWEGKYVDESVFEKLISSYFDYFSNTHIGKDKFLTFRIPNPYSVTDFRIARAFMVFLTTAEFAKKLNLHTPPLFEAIVPMIDKSDTLVALQRSFQALKDIDGQFLRINKKDSRLELIPLFEKTGDILNSSSILTDYILSMKKSGNKIDYMRPLLGRSDPALYSGIVSTTLAIKIALSEYIKIERMQKVKIYPITAAGVLPFRGGANPYNLKDFIGEFEGIKTLVLQSAFRYDFPKEEVIKAISFLNQNIQKTLVNKIPENEINNLKGLISNFEIYYQNTISKLSAFIADCANFIPARRERLTFKGKHSYGRSFNSTVIPRAIPFTGSLYSLGLPPEFIGTGRGIKMTIQEKNGDILEKYYKNIKKDLLQAGRFLNKKCLKKITKNSNLFNEIKEDIKYIEKFLGIELGPQNEEQFEHAKLSEQFIDEFLGRKNKVKLQNLTAQMGILRKSLG